MKIIKNSYWIKSGFFTLLERLLLVICGFGTFYFLVKIFTKQEFGIWSLFLIVTSLIETARNGLIQNALVKYLASAKEEEVSKIITASFILNCLLTVLSVVFLLAATPLLIDIWDSPQLQKMFYLYIITTIVLIPYSQFNFIQQANMDFKGIFWGSLTRQVLTFIFVFVAYFVNMGISLTDIVMFNSFAAVCGTVVAYFFVKNHLSFAKVIDWEWVKKLFHFGKYVFGTNISSIIYNSIDQMMLGSLISTSSVAIYNMAIRITNLVEVPVNSVSSIVFPQSAKRIETDGKAAVKDLYEKSVAVILAIIVPCVIVVLLFADWIVIIIAGRKYLEAANILRMTIVYTLFLPYARQFGTLLDSIGMPKTNFLLIMSTAIINGILNYIFITNFGTIGAAFGTLFSSIIFFIISQIILKRVLDVKFVNTILYLKEFYITWFGQLRLLLNRKAPSEP